MFSDTHFHFEQTAKKTSEEKIISGSEILSKMAERNCFFGLDIGTESDDLLRRQAYADSAIAQIKDQKNADRARSFLYFSAEPRSLPDTLCLRLSLTAILEDTGSGDWECSYGSRDL